MTLPSNSCLDTFPLNTVANFKVKLPEAISLEGDLEVALVEVLYSHTWSTIRHGVQQTFLYDSGTGDIKTGLIENGDYESVPNLVKALNGKMSKDAQAKIKFTYNRHTQKVTVDVKKGQMCGSVVILLLAR